MTHEKKAAGVSESFENEEIVEGQVVEGDAVPEQDNEPDFEVSDEPDNEEPSSEADRNGPSDIPDYQDPNLDQETREQIDAIIDDELDSADYTTAAEFGLQANADLNDIADRINDEVQRGNTAFQEVETIEEEITGMNIGEMQGKLYSTTKKWGGKGVGFVRKHPFATAGAAAGSLIALPVAGVYAAGATAGIGYFKDKYDEFKNPESHKLQKLAEDMGSTVEQGQKLIDQMRESQKQIPGLLEAIQELGYERLQAFNNLAVYIGAGREKLRRLDEEELPAIQEKYEANPGHENEDAMEQLQFFRDQLEIRLSDMESERAINVSMAQSLRQSRDLLTHTQRRLQTHLRVTAPQWKHLGAQAGILKLQQKMAQADYEATQQATQMLEQMAALQDETEKVSQTAAQSGVYQAKDVAEFIEGRSKKLLDKHNKAQDRRQSIAEGREKLDNAYREHAQAVADAPRRFLESAQGTDEKRAALESPEVTGNEAASEMAREQNAEQGRRKKGQSNGAENDAQASASAGGKGGGNKSGSTNRKRRQAGTTNDHGPN